MITAALVQIRFIFKMELPAAKCLYFLGGHPVHTHVRIGVHMGFFCSFFTLIFYCWKYYRCPLSPYPPQHTIAVPIAVPTGCAQVPVSPAVAHEAGLWALGSGPGRWARCAAP